MDILRAWARDRLEVVASPEILWEYERTLIELSGKHGTPDLTRWMAFLHDRLRLIQPHRQVRLCRDPMDDMFLSCAITEKVSCIVSGDNDLLSLVEVEGIPILKPAQILKKYPKLLK